MILTVAAPLCGATPLWRLIVLFSALLYLIQVITLLFCVLCRVQAWHTSGEGPAYQQSRNLDQRLLYDTSREEEGEAAKHSSASAACGAQAMSQSCKHGHGTLAGFSNTVIRVDIRAGCAFRTSHDLLKRSMGAELWSPREPARRSRT